MSTKLWKKQLTMLSTTLTDAGTQENLIDTIIELWNGKRAQVSKLFGLRKNKANRDPNAPKKGKTAYIFFCIAQRSNIKEKNQELSATEVTTELAAQWKKLTAAGRVKYDNQAADDKKRYEIERKNYVPPSVEELEDAAQTKRQKKKGGPKKPRSAYIFFCSANRASVQTDNPDIEAKGIMKELGSRWRALSDDEKVLYMTQYDADHKRYVTEKEVFERTGVTPPVVSIAEIVSRVDGTSVSSGAGAGAAVRTVSKSKSRRKAKKVADFVGTAKKGKSKGKSKGKKSRAKFVKTPGYEFYANEQRDDVKQDHADWNKTKVTNFIKKAWKNLAAEERQEYEDDVADEVNVVDSE